MDPVNLHKVIGTVADHRSTPESQPPEPPANAYEAFAENHNPDPQEWTPSEAAEYLLFARTWTPGAVA